MTKEAYILRCRISGIGCDQLQDIRFPLASCWSFSLRTDSWDNVETRTTPERPRRTYTYRPSTTIDLHRDRTNRTINSTGYGECSVPEEPHWRLQTALCVEHYARENAEPVVCLNVVLCITFIIEPLPDLPVTTNYNRHQATLTIGTGFYFPRRRQK